MHSLNEIVVTDGDFNGIQFDPFLSAPVAGSLPSSRAINEDAAHHFSSRAEKDLAIRVLLVSLRGDSNPGFMDQRGGLEGVAGGLRRHFAGGKSAEFFIDQRQ
jgi:hypothetical protein